MFKDTGYFHISLIKLPISNKVEPNLNVKPSASSFHTIILSYNSLSGDFSARQAQRETEKISTLFGISCAWLTGSLGDSELKKHCYWNTFDFYSSLAGKENEKREEEKATVS